MSIAFGGDRCFASRMGRDTASKEGERRGGSVPPVAGGGGTWGSRRARVRFFAGKSTAARGVGVSGARRDRGEARPCARTWALLGRRGRGRRGGRSGRCLRGTRARRASSVSRSRAVSGGSRGRGKEDVARGVLTVGRGVGGTRTTGEGVDGSGLAGANEGPATKGGARGGSAMRSARRPRVSTARRGSGRDVRALEAHPMPTSPRASPAPRGASRRAFSSSPRAPPRASA